MPVETRDRTIRWIGNGGLSLWAARGAAAFARLRAPVKRAAYALYERRLLEQIGQRPMPRHIGIILDGNRRYGRARGLTDPREVYGIGAQKLDDVLDWCLDLHIPSVTLWVFSTDNFMRPADEVSGVFAALQGKLAALAADPEIHRRRIRVRAIGRLGLLPESTLAAVHAAERATAGYDQMELIFAIAYGGREEIVDAMQALLRDLAAPGEGVADVAEKITPDAISRYLYTAGSPDPDLIIRTSGEVRMSGFLLWQSAHSELYFADVNWPELRRVDFLRAIRTYQQRKRRFGR
jgi:short-chain Z-isoprenyl diphosphate synthase